MKVAETNIEIERSGEFKESNFRIKASAKAFKILSDGLYSNKIRAIVRELGTNAVDAHIAANNVVRPFKVHLPNNFEPQFSIRDYGTGLAPRDVQRIYTTYFESTKTDSNDVTGCLGLGSKSPFSYTDNFTVVNYYNGKRYLYNAFIGESGFPTIAHIGTEETTEPNGLEISFAVNSADFNRFRDEAAYVYKYFKCRPTITGQAITFTDEKPTFEGRSWKVYAGQGKNVVIMGNVAYPLDMYQVGANNSVFNGYSIVIDVNIGDVEMTASREALEYTTKTKSVLTTHIKECLNVFKDELEKKLASQPNFWSACKFYSENSLFIGNNKIQYKGKEVRCPIHFSAIVAGKLRKDYGGSNVRHERNRHFNQIDPRYPTYIIENDLERGGIERAKELLRTIPKNDLRAWIVNFTDPKERNAFFDAVGEIPKEYYYKTSELPKKACVKNADGSPAAPTPKCFDFVPDKKGVTDSWYETDFDENEGGIYVELERWTPKWGDGCTSNIQLTEIVNNLKAIGIKLELVGLRKSLADKVKDNKDWTKLEDYLDEAVETAKADFSLAVSKEEYIKYEKLAEIQSAVKGLGLDDLISKIKYVKDHKVKLSKLKNLLDFIKKDVKKVDVDSQVKEAKQKYPMLFFAVENCYSWSTDKNMFRKYVQLVDSVEKSKNVVDDEVVI